MIANPDQLATHSAMVTASRAAALPSIDCHPHLTPSGLHQELAGVRKRPSAGAKASIYPDIGFALEPVAIKHLLAAGYDIIPANEGNDGEFVMDSHPVGCHPDAMLGEWAIGAPPFEIKASQFANGYGEPGTDEVPEHVYVQMQTQMLCAHSQTSHVGVLRFGVIGCPIDVYTVRADYEMQERIAVESAMLVESVRQGGKPPRRRGGPGTAVIDLPEGLHDDA